MLLDSPSASDAGFLADVLRRSSGKDLERIWFERDQYEALGKLLPVTPTPMGDGPGTELKALLRDWLGFESSPTCKCNMMARKMNTLGLEWCESDAGMAEILGVMRDEHAKRWADGRTRLPWTDLGAKQLVRLACRRAKNAVDTP